MPETAKSLEELIKHLYQIAYLEGNIQSAPTLKDMLHQTLKESIALTGARGGTIMLRDQRSECLYYSAFQGHDASAIAQSRMKVGEGVVGTVIKDGVPKIVNNISFDPKYIPLRSDLKSELVVPLKAGDYTIGAISLDHTETNAFTETHLEFIQRIASSVGFAIRALIEKELLRRTTGLLKTLSSDLSNLSSEEIFTLIAQEIGAKGACVINDKNQMQFSWGDLAAPISFSEENSKEYDFRPLPVLNEEGMPYYRVTVPRQKGDMVFVADKTYLFMEDPALDQLFSDRLLIFISRKDVKLANQNVERETISEWAYRKMTEPEGQVYDLAVGEIERALIAEALKKNRGNRLRTAHFLGINRNTLRHKMDLYNLN